MSPKKPAGGVGELPPPAPEPPRLLPDRPLPPYRYVPGLHPHPFRHPGGHLYVDGRAPPEPDWSPDLPWADDPLWLWGIDLYDQRYYWEAHEAFEALWHHLERVDPRARLLQGLIQSAAAVLKRHLGEAGGADRLHARALHHLDLAEQALGARVWGLDLPACRQRMADWAAGGPWPLLGPPQD